MGAGPHPRRRCTSRAATSSRASRASCRSASKRIDPLLRHRPALGARREHARAADGLRGRRLDERRLRAVEGPRLPVRAAAGPDPEQKERYSRHLLVPEVGIEGQQKLLDAKVLLIGAGGLGSPAALYLAAAGVGTLGIVDDDVVDLTNLQRQVIHNPGADRRAEGRVGARRRSRRSTPTSRWCRYQTRLDQDNVLDLIARLRRDRRRRRQLPHALPAERRGGARCASRSCTRRSSGFDGQLTVFKPVRGPVLPLPVPAAAARRPRALVRRQRRAGRAAGHHGPAPGQRDDQADHRRRASRWSAGCCCSRRSRRSSPAAGAARRRGCPVCGDGVDLERHRVRGLRGALRGGRLAAAAPRVD